MKRLVVIQARMNSSRLEGKIVYPILGQPMLYWIVHRIKTSSLIDDVVIATTEKAKDNSLSELCRDAGWTVYRGSEDDVLDRYYQAAMQHEADLVVRITSDNPLIDPHVIDHVISAHLSAAPRVDYTSNGGAERTYPLGMSAEVFSFDALERAWQEDKSAWREHVTPYIHKNPDLFRVLHVKNPVDYSHHRWTVDTPEDYELIRRIYEHFGHGDFSWQDVLNLMDANPEWYEINAHIEQKKV